MKERAFNAKPDEVRAILSGVTTIERPLRWFSANSPGHCPYGKPGDRLWVRETWQVVTGAKSGDLGAVVRYRDMELLSVTMPAQKPMPLGLTWNRWRPPSTCPAGRPGYYWI